MRPVESWRLQSFYRGWLGPISLPGIRQQWLGGRGPRMGHRGIGMRFQRGQEKEVVDREGFEPSTLGLRVPCSTN
jgi:hypothetical protein